MIRGTTPTFTLTINDKDLDLGNAQNVYVTIKKGGIKVTKSGEELSINKNAVACWLTQEEAFKLQVGLANIQVNWTYIDGLTNTLRRAATEVKAVNITEQLLESVVS